MGRWQPRQRLGAKQRPSWTEVPQCVDGLRHSASLVAGRRAAQLLRQGRAVEARIGADRRTRRDAGPAARGRTQGVCWPHAGRDAPGVAEAAPGVLVGGSTSCGLASCTVCGAPASRRPAVVDWSCQSETARQLGLGGSGCPGPLASRRASILIVRTPPGGLRRGGNKSLLVSYRSLALCVAANAAGVSARRP